MTTTTATKTADDVAERVFSSLLGAFEIQAIYLGGKLGWYEALAADGPLTSEELAARTDSTERYAREWLEQQAATGYLTCEDPSAPIESRRFSMDAATAEALTDTESLSFMQSFARFNVGLGKHIDALADAYRNGGGVGWETLGDDPREAQALGNKPLFLKLLGQEFLPSIADVHEALSGGGRVADVGCGLGWSSVGIAEAYPDATVDGYDIDVASIEAATEIAAERGLSDRLNFVSGDAAEADAAGSYDLVAAFECIHDMPDPVSVLATMKSLARPGGAVIVMDERTNDAFAGPADEVEQMLYGFSLMCCLADGMSYEGSVGTGTVMRPATFEGYAVDAGFSSVEILPIEHDFFRFYRLAV
jgi:2-polyprenyl-3-methyl-5-hydroxy-6-metoxy-1,4-benzoquinol methylase